MRAQHRIRAGELPSTPVRAGLFALTRRAASTIRRCRGLQTKQCDQLSDQGKCKRHILRPGRCTDVDRRDETSLATLLPTPIPRVIADSHSAHMHSLRRRAAPTPTSYRLTPRCLILCAGALQPYPDAVIPCLARPPVTSRSLCQAASNPEAVRASLLDLPSFSDRACAPCPVQQPFVLSPSATTVNQPAACI